ncbi:MAG TPA: thioredoxin domain-containing protein [Candidatus Saccharimonadales bacterium]|nr:thioredoxin domain-containing protein [Candidatus Saccharimonadales bacterium]
MSKQFWGVILAIVLVFTGVIVASGNKNGGTGSNAKATSHIEGQSKDNITLVEYGDYECPYCGDYYPTVKQVAAEYATKIQFQFRNYPLVNLHQNAFAGARAAEAAALQGKFWQMHDLLYDQNQAYYASGQTLANWVGSNDPESYFIQDARQLGLNVGQFQTDYASDKVNNAINADLAAGNKVNVQGTPTFFLYVNGKKQLLSVGNTKAAFEQIINAAIAKQAGKTTTAPTSAGTTEQTKK